MYSLKKFFAQSPGHYLVALFLSVIVGLFRYSTLPDGLSTSYVWYEILSVSGSVTFLIGALLTVSHFGAFDIFSFAFSSDRTGEHRKYKNYAEYSEDRTAKRTKVGYIFVPYYIVGIVVILLSRLFV